MERYKCREGLVMTQVCGETLLVAARSLLDQCPFVTILNDSSAFLWQHLKEGATAAELEQAVCSEFEIEDPAEIRGFIDSFLQQMNEQHFLTTCEQGE